MDFYLILRTLQRRLWVLIVFPLIAVACAVFFVLRMDKIYSSYAHLATGFTADDAVRLNDQSSNSFEVNTRFTNVIESMHSMPVLSLVSYQLMLHDLENETPFRKIEDDKALDFPLTESFIAKTKEAYKGKKIFGVTEITSSDGITYNIILEDAKHWTTVKSDASGNMHVVQKLKKA